MKFKHFVTLVVVGYAAYRLGKISGHGECLANVSKKYGNVLFERDVEIVDDVSKHCKFIITKGDKKETASKGD